MLSPAPQCNGNIERNVFQEHMITRGAPCSFPAANQVLGCRRLLGHLMSHGGPNDCGLARVLLKAKMIQASIALRMGLSSSPQMLTAPFVLPALRVLRICGCSCRWGQDKLPAFVSLAVQKKPLRPPDSTPVRQRLHYISVAKSKVVGAARLAHYMTTLGFRYYMKKHTHLRTILYAAPGQAVLYAVEDSIIRGHLLPSGEPLLLDSMLLSLRLTKLSRIEDRA